MMKVDSIDLIDLYHQQLNALLVTEKEYLKCLAKLAKATTTEELRSALAPSTTGIPLNIQRLKLCLAKVRRKTAKKINTIDEQIINDTARVLKIDRKPSIFRDIDILRYCQNIFMIRIVSYQNLELMAKVLEQNYATILLEQTVKDNQNNYSHLLQISINVIYPELMVNQKKQKQKPLQRGYKHKS